MDQNFTATELLQEGFLLRMGPIPGKFPQPPKNGQLLDSYRFFDKSDQLRFRFREVLRCERHGN